MQALEAKNVKSKATINVIDDRYFQDTDAKNTPKGLLVPIVLKESYGEEEVFSLPTKENFCYLADLFVEVL